MRQVAIANRAVGDAMRMVRYLVRAELISTERGSGLKRFILNTNKVFVSSDEESEYWQECRIAHEFREITGKDLLAMTVLPSAAVCDGKKLTS